MTNLYEFSFGDITAKVHPDVISVSLGEIESTKILFHRRKFDTPEKIRTDIVQAGIIYYKIVGTITPVINASTPPDVSMNDSSKPVCEWREFDQCDNDDDLRLAAFRAALGYLATIRSNGVADYRHGFYFNDTQAEYGSIPADYGYLLYVRSLYKEPWVFKSIENSCPLLELYELSRLQNLLWTERNLIEWPSKEFSSVWVRGNGLNNVYDLEILDKNADPRLLTSSFQLDKLCVLGAGISLGWKEFG